MRASRRSCPPQWRALGLGLFTALASGAFAALQGPDQVPAGTERLSLSLTPRLAAVPEAQGPNPSTENATGERESGEGEPDWQSYTLKEGETLSRLGERIGLGPATPLRLARAASGVYSPQRMRSGHTFKLRKGEGGRLIAARYRIDEHRYLAWEAEGEKGFKASIGTLPRTVLVKEAYGRIQTSLFEAGSDAGLSEKTTMELARIFGWDIDFAHDLRPGDWFRVLYEEVYRHGRKVGEGDILAAEFVTSGDSHKAIRFTDAEGRTDYYHPDGRSVRKAFLRSPVKFTRITSRFSRSRDHPILDSRRAHEGVDYGAPTGTPVRSTGTGRVIYRGWKGGYGRVVKVRHANRFTTVYAHLSRFGVDRGERVKQGETIAYVGQSGLATGPHLHYEFQVRGVPRNPLKVALPRAKALPDKHFPAFKRRRHHFVAWLETIGPRGFHLANAPNGDEPS